jgi:thiamine kinase-like enzyme
MHAAIKALKRHHAKLPTTVLHGDCHFNNTYALPDGTGGLIDWQFCCRGFVAHDINYLITTALSVDMRRKNERELLAFYLDRLRSYGVNAAPDPDTLWLEYRRTSLYGFSTGWLPCPVENYGRETTVMAHLRTAAACKDHQSLKLIGDLL